MGSFCKLSRGKNDEWVETQLGIELTVNKPKAARKIGMKPKDMTRRPDMVLFEVSSWVGYALVSKHGNQYHYVQEIASSIDVKMMFYIEGVDCRLIEGAQ